MNINANVTNYYIILLLFRSGSFIISGSLSSISHVMCHIKFIKSILELFGTITLNKTRISRKGYLLSFVEEKFKFLNI